MNGVLALSRAIGDFSFKTNQNVAWCDQAVTCLPEIIQTPLEPRDEFVVLACDGIWDVMTNEQVVSVVKEKLAQGHPPAKVCEMLMDSCLSPHPFGLVVTTCP